MTREEFEKLVILGMEIIPEQFRSKIKNVAILIEAAPSAQVRREQGLSDNETLLGLYQGIPHTARGSEYGIGITYPDTITLFQEPLEEEADGDLERLKQAIADTIWHEYAHHFGLDEEAVARREEERGVR